MSELLAYLLFPLARLIYQSAPSKLRTALANGGKTLTALEVAIALYAISLRYLPAGEFLDTIDLPKPWQSLTDPWDLLIILSVLILVHHAGGKVAMNLKFLLASHHREDSGRRPGRGPGRRSRRGPRVRSGRRAGRKCQGHGVVAGRTNSGRQNPRRRAAP